ncbi:MAG: hypothetical protein KF739_01775 [Cryobacterium sp.]|nr:hypothetical protein [Micrococcales bacterium]MBX3309146.1 hypothetical protein [Cryobacterium sp.]MCB1280788.1 hypothetical protein [Salinibacterium sp.]HNP14841.1 hypothetical protein [Terrimesophilobacter sp.]
MPAHRADTRRRLRLPGIKGLLLTTALIGAASVLGVSTAAGSFANWNRSDTVAASTLRAGSLGLTINGSANYALGGTPWSSLMPGDVASQQVSVKNTGTTPATVTVSTAAGSAPIEVRVKSGACSGTIAGPSSTTTPTTLSGTLAGGATITVCIQVTLTNAAAQNQSAPFTMTFTANQVIP